jgi:hypothetical protein
MTHSSLAWKWPLVAALFVASGAHAAQRTFVASSGADGNPCSITQPCRSFATAIAATSANGEVVVLDSAGYGPVTINQSVAIVAPPGVYAGVSVFAGDGIAVNAAGGDKVQLRGLTVNGQGGARGIVYSAGGALEIQGCIVSGMTGSGIEIGAAAGTVTISDAIIERNGGNGVSFAERGSGVTTGLLKSVRIADNAGTGVQFGGGAVVLISDGTIHRNGQGGVSAVSSIANPSPTILEITKSLVSQNATKGIVVVAANGGGIATFLEAIIADNVVTAHSVSGIEIGTQSAAAGGVRAVVTGNKVRGTTTGPRGIYFNRANTVAVFTGNTVAQTSVGVTIANSAVVYSSGDNVVTDNNIPLASGAPVAATKF